MNRSSSADDSALDSALDLVRVAATAAREATAALETASDETINAVLLGIGRRLVEQADPILAANLEDVAAARESGMSPGLVDRLLIDEGRLKGMAEQLAVLAGTPDDPRVRKVRDLDDDTVVLEKRRPVGVVGCNYEARPNVTVDMASQALRARNACVLRTGSAALRTSAALIDLAVAPALEEGGLDPRAVQLLRTPDREAAEALVRQPELIPLAILRGSGTSTRRLARLAAEAGTVALAHADGGGVLYIHPAAPPETVTRLVAESVDRLGVCNRLNLLLVDSACSAAVLPAVREQLAGLSITLSEPPHDHALGYEWALDDERNATVTVAQVSGPREAARVANRETSGLAATIATDDRAAAAEFVEAYAGTGVFVNRTTRLLDGFKLLAVPETGINVSRGPGPRGPVTFRDLYIRQYVTVPKDVAAHLTGGRS